MHKCFFHTLTALLLTAPVAAGDNFFEDLKWHPGFGISNDLVWRGISQTRGDIGLVGELKWTHPSGALFGIWASNLDYGPGSDTSAEIDIFMGFDRHITKSISTEIAVIHQMRPSRAALDSTEIRSSLTFHHDAFRWTAGLNFSPNFYLGRESYYSYVSAGIPLTHVGKFRLSLSPRIGHSAFSSDQISSYTDWKLGLSLAHNGTYLSVGYTETNLDAASTLYNAGYAGSRLTTTFTKVF